MALSRTMFPRPLLSLATLSAARPLTASSDLGTNLTETQRIRERAGWLLRDSLTTLALIHAEKDEVSRLERSMNATWLDLEADRRERFDEIDACGCGFYVFALFAEHIKEAEL